VKYALAALVLASAKPALADMSATCPAAPVTIQVLGSGGPIAEGRAGTSYLLRIDGVPRVLIDAGAGSFTRFGQAGATLSTLDAIVITHLHVDHAGDLIGVLTSGSFEDRTEPLPVFGPSGGGRFPGVAEYLRAELDPKKGAYRFLSGYLTGTEGKPKLAVTEVTTAGGNAPGRTVALPHGIQLTLLPVHHGDVPAFGVEISAGGRHIVITGDQSRFSTAFASTLTNTRPDLLIAHHVVPEGDGQPLGLHRNPTSIGELAAAVQPRRLVLTHNMRRSLDRLDEGQRAIRVNYTGPLSVAADLDCYAP
jgi:ribonuclease BN (tRNA processing enzyme)